MSGSVDLYSRFLSWLAIKSKCVVIAPHYRLAPRRMWPGHFDDIKEVIEYAFDNADDLGIDKDRIVISGDGTGATIALSASMQLSTNGRKVGEGIFKRDFRDFRNFLDFRNFCDFWDFRNFKLTRYAVQGLTDQTINI